MYDSQADDELGGDLLLYLYGVFYIFELAVLAVKNNDIK